MNVSSDVAGRDRALLRPRAPITGRLTRRRRRRRSGSTGGWSGRMRSTTKRRSAASSVPWNSTPTSPSPAGASPMPSDRTTTRRGRRSTPSTWRRRWPAPGWNSAWRPTGRASAVERGLIEALQTRFPTDDPNDTDALQAGHAAYADAMAALAEAYPDDIDVQTLAADALVNVTAWALWDTRTGDPAPGSRVVEAKRILDDALATPAGRAHPGVLHLYLHTMEMSATPQDALPAADLLRGPGARCGPPAAHAQPHRRAVRRLPRLGGVESDCGTGGSAFRRARGPAELLLAVPRAQPALRGLLRDVRGQFARSRWTPPPNSPASYSRTAGHRVAADGGLAGGVRAVADSRAGAVRPLGRPDRRTAARRPRPVLHARRPPSTTAAASRTPRRANCRRPTPSATPSPPLRAHPGHPVPVQQHRPRHPGRRRRDARRRNRLPGRPIRRGVRSPEACDRTRRRTPVRRTVGLDAADPARLRRTAARAGPRRGSRRRCTPPTSAWTPPWPGRASIPAMCGACTATTNACNGWAAPPRRRSSASSSTLMRARADVPIKASCACRLEVADTVPLIVMPALHEARPSCRRDRRSGSACRRGRPSCRSRNVTPALRRRSTTASRSSTYSTIRFHPPGSWRRPSAIVREPELSGALRMRCSAPRETIATGPARCSR